MIDAIGKMRRLKERVEQLEEANPYVEVETADDLPPASEHAGQIQLVRTSIGVFGDDRKRAGLWKSDGIEWNRLGKLKGSGGVIYSTAPGTFHRVHNIYGKKVGTKYRPLFEYEQEPEQ